jgi:hypothetical protein
MGLEKFPHPQPDMGIPAVSYCYHGDRSGESIPDRDLPIAILTHNRSHASGCHTLWMAAPPPWPCLSARSPQLGSPRHHHDCGQSRNCHALRLLIHLVLQVCIHLGKDRRQERSELARERLARFLPSGARRSRDPYASRRDDAGTTRVRSARRPQSTGRNRRACCLLLLARSFLQKLHKKDGL